MVKVRTRSLAAIVLTTALVLWAPGLSAHATPEPAPTPEVVRAPGGGGSNPLAFDGAPSGRADSAGDDAAGAADGAQVPPGEAPTSAQMESAAAGTTTTRVPIGASQANGNSSFPSVGGDGRFVAFRSVASNLTPGDTNGVSDVFVTDRASGDTRRVSVSSEGLQANAGSYRPSLSANGRHVVFMSLASNLVAGDTGGYGDVFVHDRDTGVTERVSVSTGGVEGDEDSSSGSISDDGRYVTFSGSASNFGPDDDMIAQDVDVFLRDRVSRTTRQLNLTPTGGQPSVSEATAPVISRDGSTIAFAANYISQIIIGADTSSRVHVVAYHRPTGELSWISRDRDGGIPNGSVDGVGHAFPDEAQDDTNMSVSGDGRFVAFVSAASDMVAGDTNSRNDVFVRDRNANTTGRVSVITGRGQANGGSLDPTVSDDGRYIAFESLSNNLVPGDTNTVWDVFQNDRQSSSTTRVSIGDAEQQATLDSRDPAVDSSGALVAFGTASPGLVEGDTNSVGDVFARGVGSVSAGVPAPGEAGLAGRDTLSVATNGLLGAAGRYRFRVMAGPNAGKTAVCQPVLLVALPGSCPGTAIASLADPASATMFLRSDRSGIDLINIHQDADGDGVVDAGEATSMVQRRWFDAVDYAALGDSFSAGDGVFPYLGSGPFREVPSGDLLSDMQHCSRSTQAYPQLARSAEGSPGGRFSRLAGAGLGSFDFVACTGAVSANVITGNVGQIGPAEQAFDWDQSFVGGQQLSILGAAADGQENVDLLTISIGGNDARFADIITLCATTINCENQVGDFTNGQSLGDWIPGQLAQVEEAVTGTMYQTRAAVGLDSTVVLVGYPALIGADAVSAARQEVCPITKFLLTDDSAFLDGLARQLNVRLAAAARRAGVHFVDPSPWFAGHEVCSIVPYIYGLNYSPYTRPGEVIPTPVQDGPFHPNALGQRFGYTPAVNTYLTTRYREGAYLTRTGLPANPSQLGPPASPTTNVGLRGTPSLTDTGAESGAAAAAVTSDTDIAAWSVAGASATTCGEATPLSQITVTGVGFTPGSAVDVTSPEAATTSVVADSKGIAVATVTAPPSVPATGAAALFTLAGRGRSAAGDDITITRVAPVTVYPTALTCDTTSPTISITSPTPGATVKVRDLAPFTYTCADQAPTGATARLVACDGDVPTGQLLDTSRVGVFTSTVVAYDSSGNTTEAAVTYTVLATEVLAVLSDPSAGSLMAALSQVIVSDHDGDPLTPRVPALNLASPGIGTPGTFTVRGCTNPNPATVTDATLALAGQPYLSVSGSVPALTPACRPDAVTTTKRP